MTNAEILRSWAQNEEMIDQFFTEHGKDCNTAADELDALRARVQELFEVLAPALNYINHVGANYVMRGQPHPQQKIIDALKAALAKVKP